MCENLSSQSRSSPAASSAVSKSLAVSKNLSSLTLLTPHHLRYAARCPRVRPCEKTFHRSLLTAVARAAHHARFLYVPVAHVPHHGQSVLTSRSKRPKRSSALSFNQNPYKSVTNRRTDRHIEGLRAGTPTWGLESRIPQLDKANQK